MRTYKDYINESTIDNEKLESLQKLVKDVGNGTNVSVEKDRGFFNYYITAKKGDYYVKYLMDPYRYDRTKENKFIGMAIYHKGYFIYDHINVSDLNKIIDYMTKMNKIFTKADAIISDTEPDRSKWKDAFKKLNSKFIVDIDELMGVYEIYVNLPYIDPYFKVRYPFFGFKVKNVSKLMDINDFKVTDKFFGFYDNKLCKEILDRNEISKAISAFEFFVKVGERIGYN